MQVKDMFPARYLRGQDMTKPVLIELKSVEETTLRPGPDKPEEKAFVLWFEDVSTGAYQLIRGLKYTNGKGHALVLRKALAEDIMNATGTQDTDEWKNKRVVLYPEKKTVARREVVSIRARVMKAQPAAGETGGGK